MGISLKQVDVSSVCLHFLNFIRRCAITFGKMCAVFGFAETGLGPFEFKPHVAALIKINMQ